MSTITVPEGAAPGQTLRVTTSNGPVDIVVPPGATPGTQLPVPMPAQQPLIQQPFQQMMYRVQPAPMEIVENTSAFGAVVHTLKGEVKKEGCCPTITGCPCHTEQNVLTLFEGGIQAQSMDTDCFGLFSHTYVNVIPKHTIIGVDVDSKEACTQCHPLNCKPWCCCANSVVHFKVKKDPWMNMRWWMDETNVYLKMGGITDSHILFDYVYGVLAKSGVSDRAHNLAHMMAGGLCDKADVTLDLGFSA